MKLLKLNIACGFLVVLLGAVSAASKATTYDFEGNQFNLELPAGYQLVGELNPKPGLKMFGFGTAPRSDGTHGMIEVSFLDLKSFRGRVTLDKYADSMILGVHRQRSHWKQTESSVSISGATGKKFEWSGNSGPSPEWSPKQPPADMRGVMIVGMKGDVGFTLNTQDVVRFADQTIPLCEKALITFNLIINK